jgi:polar amino acid transport system permease protein
VGGVTPFLPRFWDGFVVTVNVTVSTVLVVVLVAFIMGYGRMARSSLIRWVAGAFIEFFRGTSAVVQLFWAYFVLPLLPGHLQLSSRTVAVAVLGLNGGCYAAEIVRGAVQAVTQGQTDAGVVLGLSAWRRQRSVILPQAIPIMLPAFGNICVDMMKASALVSFVNVEDLTYWAEQTRTTTGSSAASYAVALSMYFAFGLMLAGACRLLEQLTPLRRIQRAVRRVEGSRIKASVALQLQTHNREG